MSVTVILASGYEEMDMAIAGELDKDEYETRECYYRGGVDASENDVVVISEALPGEEELIDVIKHLRITRNARVILLAGDRSNIKSVELAKKAVALAVYDIVWNPLSVEAIVNRVKNPAKLSDVGLEPDQEITDGVVEEVFIEGQKKEKSAFKVLGLVTSRLIKQADIISQKKSRKKLWPLILSSNNGNVIAVISGEGGGKTTVAVNLAVTLSMQGYTIAFIDGDLESLAAHRLVGGVPAGRSLIYALENPAEATELLEPVPFAPQMYALTADPVHEIDARLYSRLPEVIKKVSSVVDMVIVDTPPEIKRKKRLAKAAGRTVIVVSPGDNLEKRDALKVPRPVLVLNRWPAGMDVSYGEELYGLRASCVIPELEEIIKAEQGGVPAVLGCSQLYRALNAVAEKL